MTNQFLDDDDLIVRRIQVYNCFFDYSVVDLYILITDTLRFMNIGNGVLCHILEVTIKENKR